MKIRHGKDVNAPQIIYTCNIIPLNFPARFPVDIDKRILKCIWKSIETIIAKILFLKKRIKLKELCYLIIRLKMKQPYQDNAGLLMEKKNRSIEQKLSRNSSHKYGQMISTKFQKAIQ